MRRWHRACRSGGEAALAPKPASGAPPRLSEQQKSELAQALIGGARQAGYANELWTGRRVADLIRQRFGVRYNEHYVLALLRSLGFTPQRPEPQAREKNPAVKAAWLRWLWPAIRQSALRRGEWLVFLDETGLLLTPLVRRTWAPRGQTPKLAQVMGRRKHLAVIGALCVRVKTGRLLLHLGFFPEDSVDGELIRHFVEGLLGRLRGAVTLVWGGLGAHLSEEMEECLDGHRRLRLSLFPAHCPELNPVEWLWRWLKWDKLANDAPAHAGGVGLSRSQYVFSQNILEPKAL